MKAIALDFDGVIHQYTTKWTDAKTISDPPVPGAFAAIQHYRDHGFKVIIYSARLTPDDNTEGAWQATMETKEAMREWFLGYGVPMDVINEFVFWTSPGKPHALIYIDDRGYRFEGTFPTAAQVYARPWKVTNGVG
jgi:hypothetical protein